MGLSSAEKAAAKAEKERIAAEKAAVKAAAKVGRPLQTASKYVAYGRIYTIRWILLFVYRCGSSTNRLWEPCRLFGSLVP